MRPFFPALFMGGLVFTASAARAQASFSFGPQVGLNVCNALYSLDDTYHTRSRSGFEAGLVGSLNLGYVALQPALLFSQKGYHLTSGRDPISTGIQDDHYRLNYLTLPAKVVATPRKNGQGIQFIAGFYLGLLVGGHYERNYTNGSTTTLTTGPVIPSQEPLAYGEYSSQRFDAGLLAGLGYRYKQVQVQAVYALGGTNQAVPYTYGGGTYPNSSYSNRAFQVSLAYLLTRKS